MGKDLRDAVVVITGASSGIGRATALEFARRGSKLALAARRESVLEEVAEQCRRLGAQAIAVPTDVADQAQVERLAERTLQAYGRIDVWVNNAGVTMLSRFEDSSIDSYRRVIETNLWGTVYGARAALPVFRRQRAGVLVNVASLVSDISQPYTSAYQVSKHGIRALGSSLRQELLLEGQKDIHVCTVMPAVIDTPIFEHAANFMGRRVTPIPPAYPAEKVAETIVRFAEEPGRETFVGGSAWLLHLQQVVAPGLTERQMALITDRAHFDNDVPVGPSNGNLFTPMEEGKGISGGWRKEQARSIPTLVAAGLAAVGLAFLVRRVGSRSETPKTSGALAGLSRGLSDVRQAVRDQVGGDGRRARAEDLPLIGAFRR